MRHGQLQSNKIWVQAALVLWLLFSSIHPAAVSSSSSGASTKRYLPPLSIIPSASAIRSTCAPRTTASSQRIVISQRTEPSVTTQLDPPRYRQQLCLYGDEACRRYSSEVLPVSLLTAIGFAGTGCFVGRDKT
ncbi:hypothetical protein F5B22DRAFT_650450 [Xylaria bambusicola]|uniref:uncharacterized protein n=1 Tax=Xylaria bambusicola TaxID=326684 RepID=UPI002007885A|nr:uncharacterized protein F5B22DRAFT_650450 [Xylaria bambusicola]KAI0506802.1 hypothetical protein F5B22DRAFT_650450 [Xylaria bambusicola]